MLRTTPPEILAELVQWRKRAHFIHANAFAQYYLLCEEWQALTGARIDIGPIQCLCQMAVLNQAKALIQQSEVTWAHF